jgi:hypothetical protein
VTVRALGPLEGDDAQGTRVQFNGKEAEMLSLLVLDRNEYVQTVDIVEGVWGEGAFSKENQVSKFSLSINAKLGTKDVRSLRNPGRYGFFGSTDVENAENILKSVNAYLHVRDVGNALGAANQGLALWRGRPFDVLSSPSPEVIAKIDRIQNLQLSLMQSRLTAHWLRGDLGQLRTDAYEYLRHFPMDFHLNKYHLLAALERSEGEYYNEAERIKELHEAEGYEFPDELATITDLADEKKLFRTVPDLVEVRDLRPPDEVGVRANIPGAMYSDFVRTDELDELRLALDQSLPIIALTALGGRGKRALAHKLCTQLREDSGAFKSIVWVSDRELPGSTTLTTVLDHIALTTKNPRLSKGDLAEKSFEALASLSSEPTLVVLDHFETMRDPDLVSWITRVGGRSKVLLTSIRFPRSIEEHCFEVKIHTPDLAKRDLFLAQLLRRKNLAHLADDPRWREYWDAANGNYRLIEWAVGQTGRREHSAILSDLTSGNGDVDIVTSLLLRDSWNSLNGDARMALSTLSLFPYGVTHKQFEAVASIPDTYSVMAELMDVDFVTVSGEGGYSLYMVDPLVASRARELDNFASIERWLAEWSLLPRG